MFLKFSILQFLIKLATSQNCRDHPFFYGLCNYQVCGYENAERYCPVTCGRCRSFVESSISYVDKDVRLQDECSPQISQAMRCEYKESSSYFYKQKLICQKIELKQVQNQLRISSLRVPKRLPANRLQLPRHQRVPQ